MQNEARSNRARPIALSLLLGVLAAVVTTFSSPKEAHATDFYMELGLSGGASTWPDDPHVQGGLILGFEFADIIGIEAQGRIGYSAIDQRILEMVGIGIKLSIPTEWVMPYLRVGGIHMHEGPVGGMHHDPAMHLLGVGDALRHRFGAEIAPGLDVRIYKSETVLVFGLAQATIDIFPDEKGPLVYGGATLGAGFQYDI